MVVGRQEEIVGGDSNLGDGDTRLGSISHKVMLRGTCSIHISSIGQSLPNMARQSVNVHASKDNTENSTSREVHLTQEK
ncbi:hypothetical protein SUGI_0038280 [Cryptomeria japonica]|nr:hypothetical protein SUGI_0038280 [Cryptomeria japonica]